jgi:hypothetical protein
LHCHADAVKRLLGSGARVDTQDDFGCTPLHWAIYRHFEVPVIEAALTYVKANPPSLSLRPIDIDGIDREITKGSNIPSIVQGELRSHGISTATIVSTLASNVMNIVNIVKSTATGKGPDTRQILKTTGDILKKLKEQQVDPIGILEATLVSQEGNITKWLEQRRQEAERSGEITEALLIAAQGQRIDIDRMIRNDKAVAILTEALRILASVVDEGEFVQLKNIIKHVIISSENAEFKTLLEGYGVDVEGLLTWWMALGV